ncbi:MAG: hypothetical protein OMM_00861 [Candidatus Magnetoglobus multicellularis str. Araruama]|uniref:LamG-like jellyroll fold domain-containing protein n=1 Tax=Candidatus Magnetoglobus multicellularis str. Araruama TaxID=890399 RepID=A0A1V1PFJ1_9BACT|nr:MAG: hypothetical protein OMM_00861 [Candidatus Magnetoglobus multicellularis str. Araruama]
MNPEKQMMTKKGIHYFYTLLFFLFISATAYAIEWTYYDLNDQILQNPTESEIENNAVMRISDTGITQYSLEIDHDFSGTWGTGYLENIGNPSPGVGKHWKNINEEVTCNVDGIVQDVYNVNSRYVATGYYAQGPPNSDDKAAALIFDGKDDYVAIKNVLIKYPSSMAIKLWAKRDRLNVTERLAAHVDGIYVGFDSDNKAVMGTYSYKCVSDITIDTGWHKWEFKYQFFKKPYHDKTARGLEMWIYMDDVKIGYKKIEPECWTEEVEYQETATETGCYVPDWDKVAGENDEHNNEAFVKCKELWGEKVIKGDGQDEIPVQLCYDYNNRNNIIDFCDQCYEPKGWVREPICKEWWWGNGPRMILNRADVQANNWLTVYNMFDYKDTLITNEYLETNYYPDHHVTWLYYNLNRTFHIGRSYSDKNFQGKIKEVKLYKNGYVVGRWKLNDGDQSLVAKDSWYNNNGNLKNFDRTKCWLVDPKISKQYNFSDLQERQKVKKFNMTSPGKIVYDWGRQHAVIVNSLPENLSENISVEVNEDEAQSNHTGAGKYWYNHGSNIAVSADEAGCQKLSGYKNNITDPSKLISSNNKQINDLNGPVNLSWVYSPYLFEETVTIGSPVILSTVPPNLIKNINQSIKPKFISTDASETEICVWNSTDKRMYPLHADTVFDLEYDLLNTDCDDIKVIVRVTTKWPDYPHIIHVANTPPVNLDPMPDDHVAFMDIKHVENDAVVGDLNFSATQKGRSILHFKRNYIENAIPKRISLSFDGEGYVETVDPIGLGDNFTIEFYAKRQFNGDYQVIIGQGVKAYGKGLNIRMTQKNNFVFNIYRTLFYTPESTTDHKWHHWACVYETDISEISEDDPSIGTDVFTCENYPGNSECQWGNSSCYNKEFIGGYDNQRNWNHLAKVKRQCGASIKYIRKIYCDGKLVAEKTDSKPYIGQGKIRLGMRTWKETGGFAGQLDEVRIWDVARTQKQIKANMNKSLSGDENSLLAYFPMNRIGSSYLDDGRVDPVPTRIAELKDMDPSNSWKIETEDVSLSLDGNGYAETDEPIGLGDNFTIEFYAKRKSNGDYHTVIGQGVPKQSQGLTIRFSKKNNFMFGNYGPYIYTNKFTKDKQWHHWACVYETDVSKISGGKSSIDTDVFTCENDPDNPECQWKNLSCYNKAFVGEYEGTGDERKWNPLANVQRQCGENIKYTKKIYCDGKLLLSLSGSKPYIGQGTIRIGMRAWNQISGFKGNIDEVRIWGVAKTQEEIEANMNERLAGDEAHLLAYFPIDRIGSPFLEDGRVNPVQTIRATLKHMNPSTSWSNDIDKLTFKLEPSRISTLGQSCVRVVETMLESETLEKNQAIVGYEIVDYRTHDRRVPHNGYVFFENVPYNTQIYNRETLEGPIYPVNTKNPAPGGQDSILVIWYKMQDSVSWPYQPVSYTNQWPSNADRIVIASRMGSEGKHSFGNNQTFPDANQEPENYFDPERYQDIQIYNQPDPLLPGYNPNEEHAIITGSYRHSAAAPRPFAAFALRNDLNITTNNASFTSEPLVLVQYYDAILKKHGMVPFHVEENDASCGYTFDYLIKAGDPVVAPYPLNEVIGATPPAEIYGTNGNPNQNCYWKDHKGQSWAISGGGQSIEIASASVKNTTPDAVDYVVNLESETMIYGDRYLIKVNDDRGFMGMMYFVVGSADSVNSKSSVYVDGNSISVLGGTSFTVTLRQGTEHLSTSHFKLYHFKKEAYITVNYWYPLQPSFWWDSDTPGDSTGNVGLSIPWLPEGTITENDNFPEDMLNKEKAVTVKYDAIWPGDVPILKAGETLSFPGGEYRSEHTTAPGLPGTLGWATGQLVYDALNPTMESESLFQHYLVRLVPGLLERKVHLALADFPEDLQPASKRVDVLMNKWYFKELHAGIKARIYYDPTTEMLCMKGFINDKTLGDDNLTASPPSIYVLQPNIMTGREKNTIKSIEGANATFQNAVDTLYALSKNPDQLENRPYSVGLELYSDCVTRMISDHPKKEKYINDMFYAWLGRDISGDTTRVIPKVSYGPGLTVVPNGALIDPNDTQFKNFTSGYITLVENNHPDMGALPVTLHIIKVVKEKVRGAIKTIFSENVFDEKITLRHTSDFGANPDDLVFQWWYREEDGSDQPTPNIVPDKWLIFPDPEGNDGVGMAEISLSGAGAVLLVDNLFYVRYRHKDSNPDDSSSWSQWAGAANSNPERYIPQLAEGWVKRVLNGINPFEARISNFYNTDSPATYVSMIRQLGPRFEGAVAFNPAKDVIENVGLIELYQTVLNRASSLSINLEQPVCTPGITTALLLASTRISSFYNLLGNDAYTDALDPTIGFGTDSEIYGSLAPTIFSFMNQTPSLLDEELTLLCGRAENGARPAYNRFLWNFTKAEGEAAYALSYNMYDVNYDGFIDEADGRILYPQGHGDAWGHYLTALKCQYDLLSHPQFIWIPRAEKFAVEGVVIDVDYFDERKFAETAASKAKVGSELINIIYRKHYVEDPEGQWQGYKDSDDGRAWGVTGWGRRAYLGSLFDWTMANAIIPAVDPDPTHVGLKKVDRTTVMEILDIASQARSIQKQYDDANSGLNPLGLVSDVVPFDINPARLRPEVFNTATHFEQVYENALEAMENARAVFDYANEIKNHLREVILSEQEFADEVIDTDRDYRNKLIEVFGTPYEGVIGPGKAYPPGYKGPDYYFYSYIDVNEVSEKTIPPPSQEMTVNFSPQNQLYIGNSGENYETSNDIPALFTQFFDADLEESAYVATDFSGAVDITFPISAGDYSFQAPSDWGIRKSPGEIQVALIELVKAEADLQLALAQYSGLVGEIGYKVKILQARSDLNKSELDIAEKWKSQTEAFLASMVTLRNSADVSEAIGEEIKETADAAAEYLPKIVGIMGADTTSAARGAIKTAGNTGSNILRGAAFGLRAAADGVETQKELAQFDIDIEIQKANYRYDIQQILAELEGLLGNEAPTRIAIFKQREHMRQVSEKYRSLLSKGLRLLEERKVYNARVAAKTQGKRYMDMAFRLNLNKSLSKYRNAFDAAARYVYLAAKAYDYDTNLNDRDPASAKLLLTDIVRQRHLGQFKNGQYVLGQDGLGDILATMSINYNVLKNQMGFNTPQTETGRFSLRSELMRIKHVEASDAIFRDELKKKCVDDLWTVPEFRKFCRPFASKNMGEQPGLILTFGTKIFFGQNFFGWPLSGGDHTYDPTNFATKVRSVGVWFEGYDNSQLSETPRVYLFPTGMDVMLVADSTELDTREWTVVDQRLPIPLPVRGSDLNNPSWIPSLDSLDGSMIQVRRFSSFRAYHDNGYFDENEMSFESRLVGRSVWNTSWMLIIPGGIFHYDQDFGLEKFIENVKDIKLFFQTYAISGN